MPAPKKVSKTIVPRKKGKGAKTATSSHSHRARQDVPLLGREALTTTLASAHQRGGIPTVMLLTGASGVGKRRMAEWIAQLELCTDPTPEGPCNECKACRMAMRLEHPDLHWFGPHPTVGGGSLDTQVRAVDEVLAERRSARRDDSLAMAPVSSDSYYVATIHALRRRLTQTPVMGSRRVVLLTDADRLLPHDESTAEAANALLKLLEEPSSGTTIRVTATNADKLPATIRSRLARFAVPPLLDTTVSQVLESALTSGFETEETSAAIASAHGSIGRAVYLLTPEGRGQRAKARSMLEAVVKEDAVARMTFVRDTPPSDSRGGFMDLLIELGDLASRAAAAAAGLKDSDSDVRALAQAQGSSIDLWVAIAEKVNRAYAQAQRNLSPPLVLAQVLSRSATV